ncbi:MAG: nitrous oxide reductase accessory protein NosL [Syntrophobacteraceae bacterium]|jgi:nitrous oxide reductase accessory protein NosL|nr:nitrous oxide reductase accessory protein NosL [Syntrophobacteraceae bacterium]
MKRAAISLLAMVLMVPSLGSAGPEPATPAREDKCPVCGMFVAKYPDFLCQVVFKDGSRFFFDGAKDMFKYYWNVSRYSPGRAREDIQAVFVTEYYDLKPIDGHKAHYVIGSTVYGPMGKELIPFEKEEDAREFLVDHSGSSILKFGEVTVEILKSLD